MSLSSHLSFTPPGAEALKQDFYDRLAHQVIPFWETYSPDHEHGGYYNCLDRDGQIFDSRKHVWLQGRQVWMFSKLFNTLEARPEWLRMAKLGADFLMRYAMREDGRVYFSLTADGKPLSMQRKIFSECFWIMAMAEYSRASGDPSYMEQARIAFSRVWHWSKDLSQVGRTSYPGETPSQGLAIPMILLNLIEELAGEDWNSYASEVNACIERMLMHVHTDTQCVYELIGPSGEILPGYEGRTLNPGHAIEAGWFLQHWALRLGRQELSDIALKMVRWSFDRGWDSEHGGLFYFLDADGYSPTALEWDMKLWWPHCEAMYAHLLHYRLRGEAQDWERFERTYRWTMEHFPDPEFGEWYGYLNRRGEVTHRFKGGPYKGCFHVPRALWLCHRIL